MKVAFAVLILSLGFASANAFAAESALPLDDSTELSAPAAAPSQLEAVPAEEPKRDTAPSDNSPLPAVAVSIATVAEEGPAPGSLAFEMGTVDLLQDAPQATAPPEHEDVATR